MTAFLLACAIWVLASFLVALVISEFFHVGRGE